MKQKLGAFHLSADEAESVTSDVTVASAHAKVSSENRNNMQVDGGEEDHTSSDVPSKGGVTSEIQRQLLSFLNRHSESKIQPRREIFVKFIKTSIEDLEEEVYLDLEFEMYQLIHRHQQRDKQL